MLLHNAAGADDPDPVEVIVPDHPAPFGKERSSGSGAGFRSFMSPFFCPAEIADDEDQEPAGT
jgi:hypothetical protein